MCAGRGNAGPACHTSPPAVLPSSSRIQRLRPLALLASRGRDDPPRSTASLAPMAPGARVPRAGCSSHAIGSQAHLAATCSANGSTSDAAAPHSFYGLPVALVTPSPAPGLPSALSWSVKCGSVQSVGPGGSPQTLSGLCWAAAMCCQVPWLVRACSKGHSAVWTQNANTQRRRRQALLQYRRHTVSDPIRYYTPYLNCIYRIYDMV